MARCGYHAADIRSAADGRFRAHASRAARALGLKLLPEPALVEMAAHYWAMHSKYSEAELGYRSRPGLETVAATVGWLNTQRRHA